MTRLFRSAALAAACLLVPGVADAALLRYDLAGTVPGKFTASFTVDTDVARFAYIDQNSARLSGFPITYTLPNSTVPVVADTPFTGFFLNSLVGQGGLYLNGGIGATSFGFGVYGEELYSGDLRAPMLRTGVFGLSDVPRNFTTDPLQVNYRLTVTDVTAAAVPELATWGLMVLGFAAVGTAARRRTATRFA